MRTGCAGPLLGATRDQWEPTGGRSALEGTPVRCRRSHVRASAGGGRRWPRRTNRPGYRHRRPSPAHGTSPRRRPGTEGALRRDRDSRSTPAHLRLVHDGGAGGGARRREGGSGVAAAFTGPVRARCPSAPSPRPVPGIPGAESHLPRHLLAKLRVGGAGHGGVGDRGRIPAGERHAEAHLRATASARSRPAPGSLPRSHPGRCRRVVQSLFLGRGIARAGGRGPGRAPDRAVPGGDRPGPGGGRRGRTLRQPGGTSGGASVRRRHVPTHRRRGQHPGVGATSR